MIKEVIILMGGFLALGYSIPVDSVKGVDPEPAVALKKVHNDFENDDLSLAASAWNGGGWGRGNGGGWGHGGYGGDWGGGYGRGWGHRGYNGWGGGYGGGRY